MILDITNAQLPKHAGLKAVRLQQLSQNNFCIPPSCLVLDPYNCEDLQLQQAVVKFSNSKQYAVRSCYQHEDGKHSFAGVFESQLYVDASDLSEALQYVVSSVESDRAQAYAATYQLSLVAARMGVIIQPMIVADEYGVCFTAAPNDSNKIAIATSTKPGGVTSGEAPRSDYSVMRSLATQSPVTSIERTCLAIEVFFGTPQNIEFAVVDNQMYILQARPLIAKMI